MKYFLLHNRRHLGPYTLEQLESLAAQKSISHQAYVVSEENADLGKLNYQRLMDLPNIKSSDTLASNLAHSNHKKIEVLPTEEVKMIEKTFNEAVDPLDLVGPPSGVSIQGDPMESDSSYPQKTWWEKIQAKVKSTPRSYYVYASVFAAIFLFAKSSPTFLRSNEPVLSERYSQSPKKPVVGSVDRAPALGRGGSLSDTMKLGPAVPRATIQVPKLQDLSNADHNDAIEVDSNIEQGASPEPALIKRRGKKSKRKVAQELPPSSDELDGADEESEERDPASEEEEYEEGSLEDEQNAEEMQESYEY